MPTPGAALLGAAASAGPSSSDAAGPSTATTTARAAMVLPSASVTIVPASPLLLDTAAAGVLSLMEEAGRRAASWSDTAPMPSAGRQFWPAGRGVGAAAVTG